jgi:hypothetical protein
MIRFGSILGIGFSLIMAATVTSRAADPIGVAACDDFLTKYEACLASKIPAAQRTTFQSQIDQTRRGWAELAKNPSTKASLEAACKQTSQQMNAAMQAFGCAF